MKTKTEFTSGPYLVKNEGHYFRSPAVFGTDGKQLVASVYGANQEELQANVRLIAAAPELLNALQELMLLSVTTFKQVEGHSIYQQAVDAIEKAKGKQQ